MFGVWALRLTGIVQAVILLAISFFVLVVLENVKKQQLKVFGRIVLVLLWISAVYTVSTTVYMVFKHPRLKIQRRIKSRIPSVKEGETQVPVRKK